MSRRADCLCSLGVAPCGSPAAFRCITGAFPSDAEILEATSLQGSRVRCSETGLEWDVQPVVDFHDRADWSWKLATESGEAFAAMARAGRCRVRAELVARTLDAAGRSDLAIDIRREALTQTHSFAEEGDLLGGLVSNLQHAGEWREIVDRVDFAKRPFLLRFWALAKFHLGEFDDTVSPLILDLSRDQNWEPMHRGTGEPFIVTIDSFMPKYSVVAGFQSGQRERCSKEIGALATRWPKSLRLGLAAALLDSGNTVDWVTNLRQRGEVFAGLTSSYKLGGKPQGLRIADSLMRDLKREGVFVPFLTHDLSKRTREVLQALDPQGDVAWLV